jgi:glyoxylase-like metal-dependent hydrolase (beta-lactamase superfamily II)
VEDPDAHAGISGTREVGPYEWLSGEVFRAGQSGRSDASVQVVTMPGHTRGTISFLFEVKDTGKRLRFAYVGGTAIPFDGDAGFYNFYLAASRTS